MIQKSNTYNLAKKANSTLMILTLLWLTVSIPYVFEAQQKISLQNNKTEKATTIPGNKEDAANPFSNTTEEKAPSATSLSEEYLHNDDSFLNYSILTQVQHNDFTTPVYNAFTGKLLSPPPEA